MRPEERRSLIIIVTVVIVVVLITSIIMALTLLPLKDVSIAKHDHVDYDDQVTHINLNVESDRMALSINYQHLDGKLVDFGLEITGKVPMLASMDVLRSYVFNQTIEDDNLTLEIIVDIDGSYWGSFNLDIAGSLIIDPSLRSNIRAVADVGNLELSCEERASIDSIYLETEVGKVTFNLDEGTLLNGDVSGKTTTGSIEFFWRNVDPSEESTVDLSTHTGSINLRIIHNEVLRSDVDFDLKTDTGHIDLEIGIEGNIGARIISSTSVGDVNVDRSLGFEETTSSLLESVNYPAAFNMHIAMETNVGNINIDAEYLS